MAVTIRMARHGAKKNPFYRIVVADNRSPRDGRCIEYVGFYDPKGKPVELKLNSERVKYWMDKGAKPSETVKKLIKKAMLSEEPQAPAPAGRGPEGGARANGESQAPAGE